MTLTDFARRTTGTPEAPATGPRARAAVAAPAAETTAPAPDARTEADPDAGTETEAGPRADTSATRRVGREADGLAVASFVLGLVGLLVFNLVLGPVAIVMALLSLVRRTRRPVRAYLGLALGVADLVVLAVLVTANGTVGWNLGG
ncbi:DUF4190 domain-containing protein [Streptomyces californicus]|uniref:DUF4190 domain-containing protein n=1 Tax=Streptomyces californicus TaxID=67351 RepID=UPI0036993912